MIREGIPADDVLKMKGRDVIDEIRTVGKDSQGLIVEWHYVDCVVTFNYWLKKYRVREVQYKAGYEGEGSGI